MPTLEFRGKPLVANHHLSVPVRTLKVDARKSLPPKGKKPSLDDNLIIHGDNLVALKALLPRYAGKVNCIYIDPPYNTGKESWVYNDNVNSPMMKEWLKEKSPVDGEDLARHDKWLCMMWPRLQLLRELLAEDGVIFISIDDNEQHRLRMVMDEIFGEDNFVSDITIRSNPRGSQSSKHVAVEHEQILFYCKNENLLQLRGYEKTELDEAEYPLVDPVRGKYRLLGLRQRGGAWRRKDRPNLFYPFYVNPQNGGVATKKYAGFTEKVVPKKPSGEEGRWTWGRQEAEANLNLLVGKSIKRNSRVAWDIYRKDFLFLEDGTKVTKKVRSLWSEKDLNYQRAGSELKELFGEQVFEYPKPVFLVNKILRMSARKNFIILDSFAGSGTTAHAVLELNKEDNGNRKFILVECEDYADKITAERVRRVIRGKAKSKATPPPAGSFAYCTLGAEINPEHMLSGKKLPDYETLARHLVYTATGEAPAKLRAQRGQDGFFYEASDRLYYLIYESKLTFLRGEQSALNSTRAKRIAAQAKKKNKTAVVFATHKFMGQKELSALRIEFCGLPYEALK